MKTRVWKWCWFIGVCLLLASPANAQMLVGIAGSGGGAASCSLGLDSEGSLSAENTLTNYSRVYKHLSGSCSGTATKFNLYTDDVNTSNRRFYVLVYSDDGGEPNALLCSVLINSQSQSDPAWIYNLDISACGLSISASTTYWLGIHTEYQYTRVWRENTASQSRENAGSSFGDIPSPWETDASGAGPRSAMYLTVE